MYDQFKYSIKVKDFDSLEKNEDPILEFTSILDF